MNIIINGTRYALTEEQCSSITALFHGKIEAEYGKLEPTWRLAAKAIARGALEWIENRVKAERGIEAAVKIRPAKKADPVPHLLNLGEHLLVDMMAHVTLSFETTTDEWGQQGNTLDHFTVSLTGKNQGKDGGQVDPHGHQRIRQDDRAEVPGQYVQPALS